MKNIISYSLYGDNINYWNGAIANIKISNILYPNFICRFYVDKNSNKNLIKSLEKYRDSIEIIFKENKGGVDGMFWRFLGSIDKDVNIFLSRDTDSLSSKREVSAVTEWIQSEKNFHIMRDNEAHNKKIMGGMWGCKNQLMITIDFEKLINDWKQKNRWGDDEIFLEKIVYPKIKHTALEHSRFFCKNYDMFTWLFTDHEIRNFPFNDNLDNFIGKKQIFNSRLTTPRKPI